MAESLALPSFMSIGTMVIELREFKIKQHGQNVKTLLALIGVVL